MKKLQAFLSSAMNGELNTERELIRYLFNNDPTLSEFYELFAIEDHASPNDIEKAYCEEVKNSELVIFIFNKQLRDAVLKEYKTARENRRLVFIYLKETDSRENKLKEFISSEIYNFNPGRFIDPQSLCKKIKNDFLNDLLKIYTKEIKLISEQENVEYTRRSSLTPYSTYRFFRLDELLAIGKENEIEYLSVDQLIALSSALVDNNGNYKIGLALIELALIKDPNNWILHNDRGLILETMGLSQAALFSYRKSIELNKTNETAYYNLGGVYFRLAMYEDAIEYYKQSIDYNPKKKNAISQIAACYLRMENSEESLTWAKQAFELQKDEFNIVNIISAYVLNKKYIEALSTLELIDKSTYTYGDIYSFILYKQGKFKEAIKIIDRLYEKGYLEISGAERKFFSLVSLGLEKESFDWFKKIESIYPITAYNYNNLGHMYIEKLGKSEYANYFFKKAIELDQTLLPSWQNLQYNLALLGEFNLSKDVCDETLKIFPYDKKTIQNKIRVLAEMGEFSEMMKFNLEKTIGLVGDDSNQNKIKEIVEQSFKAAGFDMKKIDELFKMFYQLNRLLNKPNA
ncbi:MAG: hypothetical protein STSR0008_23140 [Ignavibacterium sp.]